MKTVLQALILWMAVATSTALSDAEAKLQTLYSVIGRLSQLKLVDYL